MKELNTGIFTFQLSMSAKFVYFPQKAVRYPSYIYCLNFPNVQKTQPTT